MAAANPWSDDLPKDYYQMPSGPSYGGQAYQQYDPSVSRGGASPIHQPQPRREASRNQSRDSSVRGVGRKVVRRSVLRLSEVDDAWRDKVNVPEEKREDDRRGYPANQQPNPANGGKPNSNHKMLAGAFDALFGGNRPKAKPPPDEFDNAYSLFDAEKQSSSANPFMPPPLARHHSTDSLGKGGQGSSEKPDNVRATTWNQGDPGFDSDPYADQDFYPNKRVSEQKNADRPVRRRRTSQDLDEDQQSPKSRLYMEEKLSPGQPRDARQNGPAPGRQGGREGDKGDPWALGWSSGGETPNRGNPKDDFGRRASPGPSHPPPRRSRLNGKRNSRDPTNEQPLDERGPAPPASASAPTTPNGQRRGSGRVEVVRHGNRRRKRKRGKRRPSAGGETDGSESESALTSADEFSGSEGGGGSFAPGRVRPRPPRRSTDRPRRASASGSYKKSRSRTRYKLTGKYPNGVLTLSLVKESVLKADDEFWDNRDAKSETQRKHNPIDLLHEGISILKYGKRGFPHFKHLQLSLDNESILWFSKKKDLSATTIPLKDIRALTQGQTTGNFQRVDWKSLAPTSFSIIYGKTKRKRITLDVVCKSSDEASLWTMALQEIVDRMKAGEKQADIKALKCLPVWQQCFKTKKSRRRHKEQTEEQKERVQIEFHSLSQNLDSCAELIEKNPKLEEHVEWKTIQGSLNKAKARERDFAIAIKDGELVYETDVWRANLDICVLKEKVEVVIRMIKKQSRKRRGSKRGVRKKGEKKSRSRLRNKWRDYSDSEASAMSDSVEYSFSAQSYVEPVEETVPGAPTAEAGEEEGGGRNPRGQPSDV